MSQAVAAVGWTEAIAFCGLGIVTFADWMRNRDRQRAYLAWAIGLLAIVILAGRATTADGHAPRILTIVTVPLFLGSGYALILFRHSFIPIRRRTLRVLLGLVIAVSALLDALPPPSNPLRPAPLYLAAAYTFILLWCGFIIEPVVRFWTSSRRRPAVQRARLRALSLGYGGMVTVVLVAIGVAIGAGSSSSQSEAFQLVIGLIVLGIIPLLYVSFAPPGWLRRLWRDREESAFRRATSDLLLEEDPELLAELALSWALRLTGTDAGLIAGGDGKVLASVNLGVDITRTLRTLDATDRPRLTVIGGTPWAPVVAMVAPLRAPGVAGIVAVISGAFTPVFGADELARLGGYGVSMGAALDRVRLVRELASQTERHESLLAAVSDLGDGLVVTRGRDVAYVNDAYCAITGFTAAEVAHTGTLTEVAAAEPTPPAGSERGTPDDELYHFETTITAKDRHPVDVEVSRRRQGAGANAETTMIVRDVSERLRVRRELSRRATELERSNASLEEFAYVASHDLQEPIRMVASYLQLLQTRYQGSLDSDADEFIGFAVDGARRMQALINDLLSYSRVGTQDAATEEVPFGEVLETVTANLRASIGETGATVVGSDLPTVVGDRSQLVQLCQNLIGNAIKFNGGRVPEVHIDAQRGKGEWVITVTDNGMGIEPRHAERIFMVFRRLHPASEYPGTGIGLSICRKIVQRHDGRIWMDSVPGVGSSFHFTVPDRARTSREQGPEGAAQLTGRPTRTRRPAEAPTR
jgi:PAS domain S-box-containing protein